MIEAGPLYLLKHDAGDDLQLLGAALVTWAGHREVDFLLRQIVLVSFIGKIMKKWFGGQNMVLEQQIKNPTQSADCIGQGMVPFEKN